MSLAKRLDKLKTSLTPKQAVLLWLKEVPDLEKYREKSLQDRMPEAIRSRILKILEPAARNNMGKHGWAGKSTSESDLEAWKQVDFLLALVQLLNADIVLDSRQTGPCLVLLFVGLDGMEEKHEEHHSFITLWGGWRALLLETLTRLLLLKATTQALSKQYYDNHSPLFAEQEATLQQGIGLAESLANWYNDLEGSLPGWTAIDHAALQSSIEAKVPAAVGDKVARAKVAMLHHRGEWEAAWAVIEQQLRSLRSVAEGRDD